MPIYEYECSTCGVRREFIQKVDEAPRTDCPACGASGSLRRLISSPAIQFKGDGWYITDYSAKGKQAKKAESGNGDSAPAAPAESKPAPAENKPAKAD